MLNELMQLDIWDAVWMTLLFQTADQKLDVGKHQLGAITYHASVYVIFILLLYIVTLSWQLGTVQSKNQWMMAWTK